MYLMQGNMKNNMVSVQDDDLKSTFYQRICCQTKQMQPVFRCGGATCTHPRRLTRHAGQDCGQPCLSNGSSTFDFGFRAGILRTTWCNYRRFRSEGPIPDHRRCATRLRSQSTVILCWFGICHAKMKACRWTGWHRSDGGPNLFNLRFAGWHSDFCPLTSWSGTIGPFIGDTSGTFAVECWKNCGANQWGATTSNSCNG